MDARFILLVVLLGGTLLLGCTAPDANKPSPRPAQTYRTDGKIQTLPSAERIPMPGAEKNKTSETLQKQIQNPSAAQKQIPAPPAVVKDRGLSVKKETTQNISAPSPPAPVFVNSVSVYDEPLGRNVTLQWPAPDFSNQPRARTGNMSADAAHTMLVYVDFQCPYSAKSRNLTRAALAGNGWLAMEWRHVPRPAMAYARRAALSAECANDQGKFWELADAMMGGQQNLSAASVEEMAEKAGVANLTLFDTCVASSWHADALEADGRAAEQINLSGTPTFVLGNRTFVGVANAAEFFKFVQAGAG